MGAYMHEEGHRHFIHWEKRFELGIPLIDKQHEHLVVVCNELYTTLMNSHRSGQSNWQEAFSTSLTESFKYVEEHFSTEETYLSLAGFPSYEIHKQLHTEFAKKVLATVNTFDDATFPVALNYVIYLGNWILQHIAIEDRQFAPCLISYIESQKKK